MFIFKKMSTKCQCINNHILPVGFSNRDGVQWKRTTLIYNKYFYHRNRCTLLPRRNTLCVLSILSHRVLKTQILKSWVFINFHCSLRTLAFFPMQVHGSEELQWRLSVVPLPWFRWRCQNVYLSLLLNHQYQHLHCQKNK